jgi:hypothetical protein
VAGVAGPAVVSARLLLEVFIMTKDGPSYDPRQAQGWLSPDEPVDRRSINDVVDSLRREIERLKAEQVVVRYVGPRMYQREVYGK